MHGKFDQFPFIRFLASRNIIITAISRRNHFRFTVFSETMSLRTKLLPHLKAARCTTVTGSTGFSVFHRSSSYPLPQKTIRRFFDFYQFTNKEAIEKERARLGDELNRGYFADISELKKHGGKGMIDSWTLPFLETFKTKSNVHLYEISFIDSWLLSLYPIKRLLLRTMRKSETSDGYQGLQRHVVYAFGDHYDLRKELNILNLLTGYIFLLDSKGRIRWQGFGIASDDEVSSMLSCASWLLEEQCK